MICSEPGNLTELCKSTDESAVIEFFFGTVLEVAKETDKITAGLNINSLTMNLFAGG